MTRPHLALVGPTASGKSALAVTIASALGDIEIVSVDSMLVYRGLDIGTAKPTREEQAGIPHHLIDVAEPHEEWSVARFQHAARDVVADIASRGRRALLVGGTGLYVQAVIDPLTFPPEDRAVRAEVEAEVATPEGLAAAYRDLQELDAVAAARIVPGNRRRVTRALEVIRITGRPFSSFGAGVREHGPTAFPVRLAGVWLPRAALADRIARRFAAMRAAGLVDEVRGLAADDALSRTARQAIGYKEVLAHLESADGDRPATPSLDTPLDISLETAFETAVARTRSFARRQRMWFRRDPRITWFAAAVNPTVVAPALLAHWDK